MPDLSSYRPTIHLSQVWCDLCNRRVDEIRQSGMHKSRNLAPTGEGVIVIRAFCRGPDHPKDKPWADLAISFADARRLGVHGRHLAFAPTLLEVLPETIGTPELPAPERKKPSPRTKQDEGQMMLPMPES